MTTALVTRPREDSEGVSRDLRDRGLTVAVEPLLDIAYRDAVVDAVGVQGILATSANGVRALARLLPDRALPVWAVGDASARTARALGYTQVESAGGDVHTLAALVKNRCEPETGAFLHAAGSVTAGDLAGALGAAGFSVRRLVLYEARPATALSAELVAALRAGDIALALFFSPRTAATFVTLVQAAGLQATTASLRAYALSAAVADKLASLPWSAVRVAAVPTQAALLAALEEDLAAGRIASDLPRTSMTETPPPASTEATPVVPSTEATPVVPSTEATSVPVTEPAAAANPDDAATEAEIAEPAVESDTAKGRTWLPVAAAVAVVAVAGAAALVWSELRPGGNGSSPLAVLSSAPSEPAAPSSSTASAGAPDLAAELAATRERLAALEARVAQAAPAAAPDLSPIEGRLGQAEAAVKALQAQPQVPAKLVEEVETLGKTVAELKRSSADAAAVLRLADRVEKAESAVRDMQARRSSAAALLLAVGQLREAVGAALPYDGELRALKALAGADPEVAAAAETLKSHAAVGVPTLSMLIQRLSSQAPAIVRAQLLPEGQGWWRQTLDRLSSVVTVEREDGATAGTTPAAVVARAQAALTVADLALAVSELEGLSGPPAEVAAPWLADARARLAAGKALSELTAHVVAAVGAGQ